MTILAQRVQQGEIIEWIADGVYENGAVIQLRDGRAGVVAQDAVNGQKVGVYVTGIFKVAKATSMVVLMGSRLFWSFANNNANLLPSIAAASRDFYLGCAVAGGSTHLPANTATSFYGVSGPTIAATANGTDVNIALNMIARNEFSLASGYVSVPVETTVGSTRIMPGGAEGVNFSRSGVAEAQKVDALSLRALSKSSKMIVDVLACINSDANAVSDTNLGLANATHASDADSITEHLFVHLDGGSTNINLQSKDGTTTVAATNTTVTYTAGTPFLVQFDLNDLADIQAYVNGVNVLPATVFRLDNATGPLKLLAHSEQSGTATAHNSSVLALLARSARV